ncbi:MAG: protein kinase domain-containing protein [Myxococcota bacterium]
MEARNLERAGDHVGAIKVYINAGYAMDASRLLANLGRFGEAGDLLLKALRLQPTMVGTLTGARRGAAIKAAVCFARAQRLQDASTIVVALGARESVIGTLLEVGDKVAAENLLTHTVRPGQPEMTLADAARIRARELMGAGQHADAARLFMVADEPVEAARALWAQGSRQEAVAFLLDRELWLEAARCQLEGGDIAGSMASLKRIAPSNPNFRQACCSLIQMAHDHKLDPSLFEDRLEAWNRSAPLNLAELQALYLWARLLEDNGHTQRAAEAFKRVHTRRPGHADVTQRLRRINGPQSSGPPQFVQEQMGARPKATRAPTPTPQSAAKRRIGRGPAVQFQMPGMAKPAASELPVTPPAAHERPVTAAGIASTAYGAPEDSPPPSGASDEATEVIKPGLIIDGRYEVLAHLGDGATASVFKAMDQDLGDVIAMKVFHLMISRNDSMAERMKLEIKACRKLSHRNIIKIFDIGSFAGHRYLTMEFLQGQTLQDAIREPMALNQSLDLLIQACRGLDEAHRHHFVHRDIKPDNLFLTDEGIVKVMDFGIAKQTTAEGMTLTGTILGTPGYMAPEQIDGSSPVSQASDQYAIGSMAYRMFTGTMVFQHEEMMPLLMMHVTETPELPSKRAPNISPEIDSIVMRLLSKKPEERFPSCAAVADTLQQLVS